MLEAMDQYFLDFVKNQDDIASITGEENHSIYDKRLTEPDPKLYPDFRLTPYSMYFYYVRVNSDGRLVIDHYFYVKGHPDVPVTWAQIPYNEAGLTALVTKLAINARPVTQDAPRVPDPALLRKGNFNKAPWKYKSYIAIFFDEANWSLRKKPTDGSESAVAFIVKEGSKVGVPNHSFFDAIDLSIKMPIRKPKPGGPAEDTRSAIVFVNHMKRDEDGHDLNEAEVQKFVFKMLVDVKSEMDDDPPTVVVVDPGGDNEGPPLPPPPG